MALLLLPSGCSLPFSYSCDHARFISPLRALSRLLPCAPLFMFALVLVAPRLFSCPPHLFLAGLFGWTLSSSTSTTLWYGGAVFFALPCWCAALDAAMLWDTQSLSLSFLLYICISLFASLDRDACALCISGVALLPLVACTPLSALLFALFSPLSRRRWEGGSPTTRQGRRAHRHTGRRARRPPPRRS